MSVGKDQAGKPGDQTGAGNNSLVDNCSYRSGLIAA
jgi:hypothetical protein